jgi:hypothetical protein
VRVGQGAGEIVKRGEPSLSLFTNEQGIVLRVSVRAADWPVEAEGLDENVDVFRRPPLADACTEVSRGSKGFSVVQNPGGRASELWVG